MFSNLFKNKQLVIILLSLIILVIVMGLTINRSSSSWPEKLVKDSISFVQNAINTPAKAVSNFVEDIQDYKVIFTENKALKYTLTQYSQVVAELNELKKENDRLKNMLEYKESQEDKYRLKVAKVIARSPDRWNNMLVINKGSKDGIEANMAVITNEGLIGKIYSVSSLSAKVQMLTDNERSGFIFALIQSEPRTYGVVEGYDTEQNLLAIKKIDLNSKVEPGQLVVSSNLGGVFPNGLVIGEIVEVEEEGNEGLSKTAYIEPAANLYHINEVFVVMNSRPSEEMEED